MDIEKVFDSLDHDFLVTVLNNFGFGSNFISWIKLLLNSQQSCVINGGNTTPYFNLEKGNCQGDPVSAYLFILALEVRFVFIKSNENIKHIEIFKHAFLHTVYADDSTFFLRDNPSVKEPINSFNQFYYFSGLFWHLSNDTFKILRIHISSNKKVQMQSSYANAKVHTLTLQETIMTFKTLTISKIVYLALITNVPKVIVKEL